MLDKHAASAHVCIWKSAEEDVGSQIIDQLFLFVTDTHRRHNGFDSSRNRTFMDLYDAPSSAAGRAGALHIQFPIAYEHILFYLGTISRDMPKHDIHPAINMVGWEQYRGRGQPTRLICIC